uniref:Uncharacterized protein n=1 Tax=Opuntia streptacantha TaxID=393608 RepID=A0A7C9ELV0_OPUST
MPQQHVRNLCPYPCHSNMHLLSTKLHAHYPAPKPATITNALVGAFQRLCKILMPPYTYYVPRIYQGSTQHCFVLLHNPVLPSLNTGVMLCRHHPSSRLLEPTWTRNSMAHAQRPTCTMQWPSEDSSSSPPQCGTSLLVDRKPLVDQHLKPV